MDSRLETVIALFGIVRAGAVAVPLNVSITRCGGGGHVRRCGLCRRVCLRIITARGSMRCAPQARSVRATSSAAIRRRGLARLPEVHRGAEHSRRQRWRLHRMMSAISSTARGLRRCRKASSTRTRAGCTGLTMPRLRCATAAAAARSARSGCSRTSAGSRCSRPCWSAARSCCCERFSPARRAGAHRGRAHHARRLRARAARAAARLPGAAAHFAPIASRR